MNKQIEKKLKLIEEEFEKLNVEREKDKEIIQKTQQHSAELNNRLVQLQGEYKALNELIEDNKK